MKRLYILLLVVVLTFNFTACNEDLVKGSIVNQANNTTAELDIMPQKLFEFAEIGDIVVVTAGNFKAEMPLVDELIGCAVSRYSPSAAFLLGIAINNPFSPSMTLISCTTNSSSIVIDTTAFNFPSFATTLRTLTSVICICCLPPKV